MRTSRFGFRRRPSCGEGSPKDPRGVLFKASDRLIMCLSVYDENEAVVGSSDHALYTFDPSTGRKREDCTPKNTGIENGSRVVHIQVREKYYQLEWILKYVSGTVKLCVVMNCWDILVLCPHY